MSLRPCRSPFALTCSSFLGTLGENTPLCPLRSSGHHRWVGWCLRGCWRKSLGLWKPPGKFAGHFPEVPPPLALLPPQPWILSLSLEGQALCRGMSPSFSHSHPGPRDPICATRYRASGAREESSARCPLPDAPLRCSGVSQVPFPGCKAALLATESKLYFTGGLSLINPSAKRLFLHNILTFVSRDLDGRVSVLLRRVVYTT